MTVMCLGPASTVCLVCLLIPNISRKCTQTTILYELLCPIFKKPLTKFLSDLSLSPIKVIIVVATCYFLRCNVTLQNTTTTAPAQNTKIQIVCFSQYHILYYLYRSSNYGWSGCDVVTGTTCQCVQCVCLVYLHTNCCVLVKTKKAQLCSD